MLSTITMFSRVKFFKVSSPAVWKLIRHADDRHLPSSTTLIALPTEHLIKILSYLDINSKPTVDSVCFSLACKRLYSMHFDLYGPTTDRLIWIESQDLGTVEMQFSRRVNFWTREIAVSGRMRSLKSGWMWETWSGYCKSSDRV